MIWGAVGTGFFIYGKKQGSMMPLFGGVFMIVGSYFIESALTMSLVSLGLIGAIYWLTRQGY